MTGPSARDPLPGEPEHRQRWRDAAPSHEALLRECQYWLRAHPLRRDVPADDLLRRLDAALNTTDRKD